MNLLIASSNPHKIQEIQALIKSSELPFKLEIHAIKEIYPSRIDPIEDGLTFEENALKKLDALPNHSQHIYLADDSGLEVTSLDNRPGIHSARYGGPSATTTDQCLGILEELKNKPDRSARFVCVIALKFPNQPPFTVKGSIEGQIATQLSGNGGFGYDPIFIPNGYPQTYGDLPPEVKAKTSHRSQALAQAAAIIKNFLTLPGSI